MPGPLHSRLLCIEEGFQLGPHPLPAQVVGHGTEADLAPPLPGWEEAAL